MTEVNAPTSNILMRSSRWFTILNIYHEKSSLTLREQLLATRLNLIGLTAALLILVLVRTFSPQTTTVVVQSPSIARFEQLINQYPSTLSCPCSQVIVPYRAFLSFSPQYHQVCSSDFISSAWISGLFSLNTSRYLPLDFRNGASSQFQILAALCRFVAKSVSNALTEFGAQQSITSHTMSRFLLDAQGTALAARLRATTAANIRRISQYLRLNIAGNDLESALQTNYLVYSVPGSRGYTTYTASYLVENYTNMNIIDDYCTCSTTVECTFPSGFYRQTIRTSYLYKPIPAPTFLVPGIRSGCIPSASILQSTLECFYDSFCLNILALLGIQTSGVRSLNASLPSRFSSSATIQSMFDELFIEEWHYGSNFTNYFHVCSPATCSYTYSDQVNLTYMITTIISLLGGLIVVFHQLAYFVVLHILRRLARLCRLPVSDQTQPRTSQRQMSKSIDRIHTLVLKECAQSVRKLHLLFDTASIVSKSFCICSKTDSAVEDKDEHFHDGHHVSILGFRQRLLHSFRQSRQLLLQLNMFKRSAVLFDVKQKLWATRIYFLSLIIAFSILTIHSLISVQRNSRTVQNPSQVQFESLHSEFAPTLSCPCSQLSVRHSSIITIQPSFHQVCSSDFVRVDRWFRYFVAILLSEIDPHISLYSQDFRTRSGSSFFLLLQSICEAAYQIVGTALTAFNDLQLVSNEPLSNVTFQEQTSVLFDQFQQEVSRYSTFSTSFAVLLLLLV